MKRTRPVGNGALPALKTLFVDNAGHSQLVAACEARGISIY